MKTKHIYYIAALAMLTACTNNEEFETITSNGMQKVTFADPFVGKNLTRASGDITTDGTEGTTSALTSYKIKVWGQEVNKPDDNTELTAITGKPSTNQTETPFYGGYEISHSESGWAADKEFYYPRDKYTFRFAAFAPADAIYDESSNPNGVNLAIKADGSLTFRGADDNSYGITNIPLVQEISNTDNDKKGWDLLVSNRVLSKPSNDGVTDRTPISFTFQHILSKLSFYVYASQTDGKKFYVKSIKAYLPKDNWTGSYKQNSGTEKPTAESKTDVENNSTSWSSTYHDTWAWEKKSDKSLDFENITNIVTPSDFDSKIVEAAKDDATTPNSYKEYVVFTKTSTDDKGDEVTLTGYNMTPSSGTDKIICKSYFLAPTPAAEGTNGVKNYNFYVKIEYTIAETVGDVTTTKAMTGYLDLSKSEFTRFRQGWHHKVYIGLAHKTIRFISATVSDWDGNHDEDMTVSREVEGWTSEQK